MAASCLLPPQCSARKHTKSNCTMVCLKIYLGNKMFAYTSSLKFFFLLWCEWKPHFLLWLCVCFTTDRQSKWFYKETCRLERQNFNTIDFTSNHIGKNVYSENPILDNWFLDIMKTQLHELKIQLLIYFSDDNGEKTCSQTVWLKCCCSCLITET